MVHKKDSKYLKYLNFKMSQGASKSKNKIKGGNGTIKSWITKRTLRNNIGWFNWILQSKEYFVLGRQKMI